MKKITSYILIALFSVGYTSIPPTDSLITIAPPSQEQTFHKISLLAVGDVLLHLPIIKYAQEGHTYNFDKIFTHIAHTLQGYDIAFYNQESIIGGSSKKFSGYPRFNSPHQIGDTMIKLGFNTVSLANNHAMDMGEQGTLSSIQFWKSKDIPAIGSYASYRDSHSPLIQEKNGIKYAIFAYTELTNVPVPADKPYLLNMFSKQKAKKDIASVHAEVDVIIISMHWGIEYETMPSKSQQDIAAYLADLGVNIIIGHHPHVIQPITMVKNTLVIYSLGNFLSSQSTTERLTGMIVTMDIQKTKNYTDEPTIVLGDPHVLLTYNYHSPQHSQYAIYPYHALNDTLLPAYKALYVHYKDLLMQHNPHVHVYPM